MIKTFLYRSESDDPELFYYSRIYALDIQSSLEKWVIQLKDFQDEPYFLNPPVVKNIEDQYLKGKLKIEASNKTWFVVFTFRDKPQIVSIEEVDRGNPDFIAKLKYLPSDLSGKTRFVISGYRPHIKFEGRNELTSGEQIFIDKNKVYPGDDATAEIRIASVDFFKNYLYPSQTFEFSEGSKLIGYGQIIEITNENLRKASS